jgi:acyl-CoA thioester hydrolase
VHHGGNLATFVLRMTAFAAWDGFKRGNPGIFFCSVAPRIAVNCLTMQAREHTLEIRIYLEDTDAQGIVYHANYLRYFERGRSEIFESFGIPLDQVARPDCRLVVYETRIKFRRPAALGDRIEVLTSMRRMSDYRLTFRQQIRRKGEDSSLVSGEVDVVAIGQDGTLKELPAIFAST